MEALKIALVTYVITAVVAFGVAGLVHLLVVIVQKYSPQEQRVPLQPDISESEDALTPEIVVAIAAARVAMDHSSSTRE